MDHKRPVSNETESTSPFHDGERAIHERLGLDGIEGWARKVVRPYLPQQHREFHTAQPFLVAAARDEEGRPWAALLTGQGGFITSPNERTLHIEAQLAPGDALAGAWDAGADVGLLGIELATRRRNRVNGRIRIDDEAIVVEVDQAFGNCPQYIQPREWERVAAHEPGPTLEGARLTSAQRVAIERADTFFIASGHRGEGDHAHFGMDASHRGGAPGFVTVEDRQTLVFPDYSGNNHFNTIGNLVRDPGVGLLFVDFETGGLLQLTGNAEIVWRGSELAHFPGAERVVRIRIDRVIQNQNAVPLRWREPSDAGRSLVLIDKRRESEDVTSFTFAAEDGYELPPFRPGQHLPVSLPVPNATAPTKRTYSLSNSPEEETYRISVKREANGLASRTLHDALDVGAVIQSESPAGEFVLENPRGPIVLISAGIGLTPLLSMLNSLSERAGRGDVIPEVSWIHGARDGAHHPLADEVCAAGEKLTSFVSTVAFSQPKSDDRLGADYDVEGRIDAEILGRFVRDETTRFYMCGPAPFMADVQEILESAGVSAEQIRYELF